MTNEQLAADIKAAITELAGGVNYPDLMEAVDQLAGTANAQAARIAELEAKLLVEREAYLRERARCEQLEARDDLTCDDIERLRLALSWEGYSTPEGLEACAARWPELVRKKRAQVVNQQLTTESPATGKDCLHVGVPDGWQLVPVQPTREMLVAINWPNDPAGYRAMLAAAPKPEGSNERRTPSPVDLAGAATEASSAAMPTLQR